MRTAAPEITDATNKFAADFKGLVKDAEDLLRATGNYTGEGFVQARTKFEQRLSQLKNKLPEAQSFFSGRYRHAAQSTDRYVHENPWQIIGVATAIGALIGFLSARR